MQNTMQIPEPSKCEPAIYRYMKSSFWEINEVLQSLREDGFFCDIELETDDGGSIFGHKVVLASASPYFYAMFTNFSEKNKDLVVIKELDSSALRLLINFIYSGKINITKSNAQVLLPASNLLQLQEVKKACCDFLQAQLCPANVIGINDLADLHSCKKLLTSSELYLQQHFSDVVEGEEFLALSSAKMVKLISNDELAATSEEKIFESVIRWVKHDLDFRKQFLPQLMEHVRLPLTSKDYILDKVLDEPILNNCVECNDYVIEALHCHLLKSDGLIAIPHNIRTKPRQAGGINNVILVAGGHDMSNVILDTTEWYDPKLNKWQCGPKMIKPCHGGGLTVVQLVQDNFPIYLGGENSESVIQSVDWVDLSSGLPCWKPGVDMLVKRLHLGFGVINNHVYAVGGYDGKSFLNSAEVFNCRTQKWRLLSSMSSRRSGLGLGVLNDLLFAIGGFDGISKQRLKSVECYHPSLDKWTSVSEMFEGRSALGVGVLDGVLYAVGGYDGVNIHRSVEAYQPSTGVWTTVADMHLCRRNAGVAVLGGLLYVVGGYDGHSVLDSVECYDPTTNKWAMVKASMNVPRRYPGVVAIGSPHKKRYYLNSCDVPTTSTQI